MQCASSSSASSSTQRRDLAWLGIGRKVDRDRVEGRGKGVKGSGKRPPALPPSLFPLPSQIPPVLGALPPYSLAPNRFPCRALAARAGRAALGGEREVALACWVGARLALALLPPAAVPATLREARAAAARGWLANLALPAATRVPLSRLVDASGGDSPAGAAAAIR